MFSRAVKAIAEAEVFIITAGAGMGVDSGQPDFRGHEGFWNAYPAYAKLGVCFENLSTPYHFIDDPHFAWGFYGHCVNMYRETIPHEGFHIIQKWIEQKNAPYFVVTSNVDGQFQKAGYDEDRIYEVHGSLHWLQCQTLCTKSVWTNNHTVQVDFETMRAADPLPVCEYCGKSCRPNVLMFGDWTWLSQRAEAQKRAMDAFLAENAERRVVVIEMGAGAAIPTIRAKSERFGNELRHATVIRINPREPKIHEPGISIAGRALEGLKQIDSRLSRIIGRAALMG